MHPGKKIAVLCFLSCILSIVYADPPRNFELAKKIAQTIFASHPKTLYCGCDYDSNKNISLASCNMESAEGHSRAHRMEWEHIVPASVLGTGHECWTENICTKTNGEKYHGRKCCEKVDNEFRIAEAELYNLWPANGLINQLRENYHYAALPFTDYAYGCNFIVDPIHQLVEPNNHSKGTVARASLFVYEKNHIELAQDQKELFTEWDLFFPPEPWEIEWAKQVADIEGYANPYIEKYYN